MKKRIPCALILAMLLTLLPISALAAEPVTWEDLVISEVIPQDGQSEGVDDPYGMGAGTFVINGPDGEPAGVAFLPGFLIPGDATLSVAPGSTRTHIHIEGYLLPNYPTEAFDENYMVYTDNVYFYDLKPVDDHIAMAEIEEIIGAFDMLAVCSGSNAEDPSQEEWIYLVLDDSPSAPQTVGSFQDVHQGDYCAEPVAWALEKGITTGTTDTTFSPAATCTTAQILTFLWRAQGSPEPKDSGAFSDVSDSDYFAKAAQWASEQGLVDGTTFAGGDPCTRSATVTYLWKLAGSPAASGAAFGDVAADAEYAQAVAWAVEQGITTGTTDTTFSPDNTCTRGQIVTFLYRDFAE